MHQHLSPGLQTNGALQCNDGSLAGALPGIPRVANFLDAAMPSNYQSRIDGPP